MHLWNISIPDLLGLLGLLYILLNVILIKFKIWRIGSLLSKDIWESSGKNKSRWAAIIALTLLFIPISYYAYSQTSQHGITLTWNNPTGFTGVNRVYRSVNAGANVLIFTSVAPVSTYFDVWTLTNQGKQACYYVTAQNVGQIESDPSNTTCATFLVQTGTTNNLQSVSN